MSNLRHSPTVARLTSWSTALWETKGLRGTKKATGRKSPLQRGQTYPGRAQFTVGILSATCKMNFSPTKWDRQHLIQRETDGSLPQQWDPRLRTTTPPSS